MTIGRTVILLLAFLVGFYAECREIEGIDYEPPCWEDEQ